MRKFLNITAEIPERLREADEALHRYGRWAMDRFKPQRCASAEGHYRIPPGESDREPRELILPASDAMVIHRALIRVPERERIVLHIIYVPKRQPPEMQLRLLRIPPQLSQIRHLDGLRMFENLWRLGQRADQL